MNAFLHQIASGLFAGGIYASIGLALVMIYQSTHTINFAQGEMAMASTYLAWALIDAGLPYALAFVLTLAISFVAGVLIERLLVRRATGGSDGASGLRPVIVFVGLLLLFNALAGALFGHAIKTFPSPFPSTAPFGSTLVSWHELGSLVLTLAMVGGVYAFFRFTPLGLAMRAAAQNPAASRLLGIRVELMLGLGWGLAAAIGAVAGMMVAPVVFLDPNMMAGILLYGFAAALLGGIDNPWGAVAGGFIVGVTENLLGAYVTGTELKLSLALVMIVAVLIFRPAGLFGRKLVTRV
jgi:branched-chain amino acid transport system permease protein